MTIKNRVAIMASDVLNSEHFVLLINKTANEPDGYGGTLSRNYLEYRQFESESELAEHLKWSMPKDGFKVIKASPLKVTTEIKISIE